MKLKNKNTGEIGVMSVNDNSPAIYVYSRENKIYYSLAELYEEWEDYEAQKSIWFVDWLGRVQSVTTEQKESRSKRMAEIGNYFKTKEEAELALKKLNAWKRLKDAGFKFNEWEESVHKDANIAYFTMPEGDVIEDLDLLFGGEE